MALLSHAQNFEDVLLWRSLKHIENGRYLDIGAQDPIIDSVSKGFYLLGWRGTHVEATPFYAAALRADRPDEVVIEAAVTDQPGPISFFSVAATGLSTGCADLAREYSASGREVKLISVATVPLCDILEGFEGKEVHWMKVDVEQMEESVLRSWGDSTVRPWILVIESTYPLSQKQTQNDWIHHVTERNYIEAAFDGLNRYFVSEDHSELLDSFSLPPNVFDLFNVSSHHFTARHLIATQNEALASLEEALATTKQEQQKLQSEHETSKRTLENTLAEALRDRDRSLAAAAKSNAASAVIRADRERILEHLTVMTEARQAAERSLQIAVENLVKSNELNAKILDSHCREKQDLAVAHEQAVEAWKHAHIAISRQLDSVLQETEATTRSKANLEIEKKQLDTEIANLSSDLIAAHDFIKRDDELKYLINNTKNEILGSKLLKTIIISLFSKEKSIRTFLGLDDIKIGYLKHPVEQGLSSVKMLFDEKNLDKARRARSLEELSSLNGMDFIYCAYATLLNRYPDADGALYYRGRLACGYSKIQVLEQIVSSDEYKSGARILPGLAAALKKHRRSRNFVWRWIYKLSGYTESNSVEDRRWRMLLHELSSLRSEIGRGLQQFEGWSPPTNSSAVQNPGSLNPLSRQASTVEPERIPDLPIQLGRDTLDDDARGVTDAELAAKSHPGPINGDIHPDLSSQARRVLGLFQRYIEFKAVS